MSSLKITALIDNKALEGLKSEHGLSILCEFNRKKYLLDTGASTAFATNAKKMDIDLSTVDISILSHAHYDHAGGYNAFFEANNTAKLYMQDKAKEFCYLKFGPIKRYVGIPLSVKKKHSDRFAYLMNNTEIDENVWLIGHSTPNLDQRGKRAHMYRNNNAGIVPDDFSHEQSLVFDTPKGLVILNSCCHAGADNVVSEVKSALPDREISALIGGFHLMGLRGVTTLGVKPEEVEVLGRKLMEHGVKHTYACHCTGDPAIKILKRVMGDSISYFSAGSVIEI